MNDSFYDALALWSQVGGSIAFIVVLVWLFQRFVTPAVVSSQERKNQELADAERRRDAARDDVAAAERERESAGTTAVGIRERAARDGERQRERIVAEATLEGQRLVRNAEGELGRARSQAHDRLREELLRQALRIAREAAAGVDDATNERLIGGVLGTIERRGGDA
jgi:F0F1-type ATP synthase membrane subunit b/b'